MFLEFDREAHYLWATCDESCRNRATVSALFAGTGAFDVVAGFERPSNLSTANNEGLAIAPQVERAGGQK